MSYTYTSTHRANRLELLLTSDETTTVDHSDGLRRIHEPGAGGTIEFQGEFSMSCLDADEIEIGITATLTYGDGNAPNILMRVVRVHCIPCDGGVDAETDPGPDGGMSARPADTFASPLIPDAEGDCVESAGGPAAVCQAAVDKIRTGAEVELQELEDAFHSFNNSTYECGVEVGGMRTVCASAGVLAMPAGELLTIVTELAGVVPLASSDTSYVYSAIFDSDGDATNDFVPLPAYPWDYYQATDRWYELIYSHTTGVWSARVTQLDSHGTRTEVPSTLRAVIQGNRVTFFLARGELPARVPAYRTTSFQHDGMYTQATRGGDVPLADPTLSLFPVGCGYTGVECGEANGALADCGADHQCATEASRGVCVPAPLDACGGLMPPCDAGETCVTEGDAIGSPSYCVTDAMLDCICAAAAGRHVFPGCP